MNRPKSLVLCLMSFILCLTLSCAKLGFISGGDAEIKISALGGSERPQEITGTSDFYFWGLSPGHSTIDFEDHVNRLGLNYPSYVSLEQNVSVKNVALTILTLGLYCPLDYRITVLTKPEVSY